MNRKWLGAGALLLLGGCASVEMAQYTVTSFAEVPLKKGASVKVVANDDLVAPIAEALKSEFAAGAKGKDGGLKVAEENADYWFILSGAGQYLKDAPQKTYVVAKQENSAGGTEVIAEEVKNYASAAKGVSVAVYQAKNLAPVYYFEIPIYTGDNTKGAVRDANAYDAEFMKDVVERVKDVFLTQQKDVETPMPLEANKALREQFAQGAKGYDAFMKTYKSLGAFDLAKMCEKLRTKTYEGSDANEKLANYYLYLLVKEAQTKDPEELRKIEKDQFMILASSDAKGLAEAVPVALARLEYKLANMK
jgi:hypothetical protein